MKEVVGVYVDHGASPNTMIRSLTKEVEGAYEVRGLEAKDFDRNGAGFEGLAVFVMPGGDDLAYCAKLNGPRNARIRKWVERGGVYFGVCGGGYYGCSRIDFRGRYRKIAGKRELEFLKGTAVGSINEIAPPYDGTIHSAAIASLVTNKAEQVYAYYNGGPFFRNNGDGVTILASYKTVKGELPAIVETTVGHGKAILSGVHPENSADDFRLYESQYNNTELSNLSERLVVNLQKVEIERRRLWRTLLRRCGLKISSDRHIQGV